MASCESYPLVHFWSLLATQAHQYYSVLMETESKRMSSIGEIKQFIHVLGYTVSVIVVLFQ